MKYFFYYLIQLILISLFGWLSYLPTRMLDFFAWGNSRSDSLYLLFVPVVLLPLIIFVSILKYYLLARTKVRSFYKQSYKISIAGVFIITAVLIFWESNLGFLAAVILALAIVVFPLMETLRLIREYNEPNLE